MSKVRNTQRSNAPTISRTPANQRTQTAAPSKNIVMPFERMNYILLLVGIGIIAFGFFLMSIGGFKDASEFSVALYIAPVVVVGGFLEIIYAIMYTPKKQETTEMPTETAAE